MALSTRTERVEWTDDDNARRCQLIDQLQGLLAEAEAGELANLQEAMRKYVNRVAPLPLEAAKRLHAELVEKHRSEKS